LDGGVLKIDASLIWILIPFKAIWVSEEFLDLYQKIEDLPEDSK
jgi:hypothetical protein